jgi:hypothetical protein
MSYRTPANETIRLSRSLQLVCLLVAGAESGRSYTSNEIAKRVGVGPSTAWRWITIYRTAELIYVKQWNRTRKQWVASYAWGFKEDDAPKPTRLPDAEYSRVYRAKVKIKNASPIERMVGGLT